MAKNDSSVTQNLTDSIPSSQFSDIRHWSFQNTSTSLVFETSGYYFEDNEYFITPSSWDESKL